MNKTEWVNSGANISVGEDAINDLTSRLAKQEEEQYQLREEIDVLQARCVASELHNAGQKQERGRQLRQVKSAQAMEGVIDEMQVQYDSVEKQYEHKLSGLEQRVRSSHAQEEVVRELQLRVQAQTRECLSQKSGRRYLEELLEKSQQSVNLKRKEGIDELEEIYRVHQMQVDGLTEELEGRKRECDEYRRDRVTLLGDKTHLEQEQEVVRVRLEHSLRQTEEWRQRYELERGRLIEEVNGMHRAQDARFEEGVRTGQQRAQAGQYGEAEARATERYKAGQQDALHTMRVDFVEREVYLALKQQNWELEERAREQETQKDALAQMQLMLRDEMDVIKKKAIVMERENSTLQNKLSIAQAALETEQRIEQFTGVPKPVLVKPEQFEYAVKWVFSDQPADQSGQQDRVYRLCGLLEGLAQIREVEGRCKVFVERSSLCSKALRAAIDCYAVADKLARAVSAREPAWDKILQELGRAGHQAQLACRQVERLLDRIQALQRASVYEQRASVPGGRVVMSVAIEADILSLLEVAEMQIPLLQLRCEQTKQLVFLGIQGEWDQVRSLQTTELSGLPSQRGGIENTTSSDVRGINHNNTKNSSITPIKVINHSRKQSSANVSTSPAKEMKVVTTSKPMTPKSSVKRLHCDDVLQQPNMSSESNNQNDANTHVSPVRSNRTSPRESSVISTLQSYADSLESKYLSNSPLSSLSSKSRQDDPHTDLYVHLKEEHDESSAHTEFLSRAQRAATGVDINLTVATEKIIPSDTEADNMHAYWLGQSAHPLHQRADPEYSYDDFEE